MNVLEILSSYRSEAQLDDEIGPEEVHSVENKGHDQQIAVLEADDVPLVLGRGLVGIDVGKKAKGEDEDPKVDPY